MRTLLIVDDNVELANLLAVVADAHGFATLLAHTGQEAFAKIEGARPDAALVDLLLPDIRGHDLLRELSGRGVPCFAMSGVFCGEGLVREAMEVYGAKGFFEKPFAARDLMERLAGLLSVSEPLAPAAGAEALEELRLDDDGDLPENEEEIPSLDEMVTSAETTGIFASACSADPGLASAAEPGQAPASVDEEPQDELGLSVDAGVSGTIDGVAVTSLHEELLAREASGVRANLPEAREPSDFEDRGALPPDEPPAAPFSAAIASPQPGVLKPAAPALEVPSGEKPANETLCPGPLGDRGSAAAAAAPDAALLVEMPAGSRAPPAQALEPPSVVDEAREPGAPPEAPTFLGSRGEAGGGQAEAPNAPVPSGSSPSSEEEAAQPAQPLPPSVEEGRTGALAPAVEPQEPAGVPKAQPPPAPRAGEVERAHPRSEARLSGAHQVSRERPDRGPRPAHRERSLPRNEGGAVERPSTAACPEPAEGLGRSGCRSKDSSPRLQRAGAPAGDETATELPFSGRDVWRPAERLPTRAERAAASFKRTGSLAVTSLPRLLTALYQGQQTGELRLRRNEIVKVIAVHGGRPVFAASNLSSERFARFAVRKGRLLAEKLAFVQAEARRAGLRNGEAMVALGLLTEEERAELVVQQIKELIWSAFDWTEGEYQFVLRASPRPDLIQVSISPGPLILEGIRTTYSLVRLRELVDAQQRFFPTADPPYQLHELQLGDKEALLLAHADGSKSVEDLTVLSDLNEREALALLHGLCRIGILEARAQPPSLRSRIVLV